jgi:hypothetical protein
VADFGTCEPCVTAGAGLPNATIANIVGARRKDRAYLVAIVRGLWHKVAMWSHAGLIAAMTSCGCDGPRQQRIDSRLCEGHRRAEIGWNVERPVVN